VRYSPSWSWFTHPGDCKPLLADQLLGPQAASGNWTGAASSFGAIAKLNPFPPATANTSRQRSGYDSERDGRLRRLFLPLLVSVNMRGVHPILEGTEHLGAGTLSRGVARREPNAPNNKPTQPLAMSRSRSKRRPRRSVSRAGSHRRRFCTRRSSLHTRVAGSQSLDVASAFVR
jgi:hypothetical protein